MTYVDKLKRLRDKLQGLKWVPLQGMTKKKFERVFLGPK